MSFRPLLALALLTTALSATARAQLSQPDGTPVPPAPERVSCNANNDGPGDSLVTVFACECEEPGVCNVGAPCPGGSGSCDQGQNGTCESRVWHNENDNPCAVGNIDGLDPWAEAAVEPERFQPTCPLTFRVVAREAQFGRFLRQLQCSDDKATAGGKLTIRHA